jgi:two-component system, LytTR family, response regulator
MKTTIRALIVDDEEAARDTLKFMLENYCQDIIVSGSAYSAENARAILAKEQVDVIFLDINMSTESGFQFLESIDSSKYMFVFVTAYDQYALRALRASAVDYLQKPIDTFDLQQATEKLQKMKLVRSQLFQSSNPYNLPLQSLVINTTSKRGVKRLCLPGMQGFTIVEVNDILSLDADNNYTIFHLRDQRKIVVSKSIKEFEEVLDPSIFVRIHKSSIINLKYLKEFSKVDGYYAVMADDSAIAVSRRRLSDFLKSVEYYNCCPYAV